MWSNGSQKNTAEVTSATTASNPSTAEVSTATMGSNPNTAEVTSATTDAKITSASTSAPNATQPIFKFTTWNPSVSPDKPLFALLKVPASNPSTAKDTSVTTVSNQNTAKSTSATTGSNQNTAKTTSASTSASDTTKPFFEFTAPKPTVSPVKPSIVLPKVKSESSGATPSVPSSSGGISFPIASIPASSTTSSQVSGPNSLATPISSTNNSLANEKDSQFDIMAEIQKNFDRLTAATESRFNEALAQQVEQHLKLHNIQNLVTKIEKRAEKIERDIVMNRYALELMEHKVENIESHSKKTVKFMTEYEEKYEEQQKEVLDLSIEVHNLKTEQKKLVKLKRRLEKFKAFHELYDSNEESEED